MDDTEKLRKSTKDTLEHNFTPSLARRLSRQFIEQTRQSLPRSPSIPREKLYRSSTDDKTNENRQYSSTISDQTEYRSRSCDRGVRRTNSLLENNDRIDRFEPRSPRRSVSLFDDDEDEESLSMTGPITRQTMNLGRKYRDGTKSSLTNFHNYRTEKIQEEPHDESSCPQKNQMTNNETELHSDKNITNNSSVNLTDRGSSLSAKSCETSPTESSSTLGDYAPITQKQDSTRDFETRLLAAENLIKESKARNLGSAKYERNLTSTYKDTDKCEKELLGSMTDIGGAYTKRRSCIPSLRLRSGSLTREASCSNERRNTVSCIKDTNQIVTPERSILSKFFRAGSSSGSSKSEQDAKEKSPKAKGPRRISRFLRPDFFDTPREESQYVKEKEAQKAAENERRKSRFTKKKTDARVTSGEEEVKLEQAGNDEKQEKELKNEANAITRDKTEILPRDNKIENNVTCSSMNEPKIERQVSKNSFLQSLEKKLEKFRSSDDSAKLSNGNGATINHREQLLRENSAPPIETTENTLALLKRPTSVEDLTLDEPIAGTSKSRVSSVLGLFKNDPTKISTNGQRPQSTILSKFKRNAYKGSRSDGVLSIDQIPSTSTSSSSKIPTKFAKMDAKSKKMVDVKKSPENTVEMKKSPSKEKSPPEISGSRKSMERQQKTAKKPSPEKTFEGKQDKPEKTTNLKDDLSRKNGSPEKSDNKISLAKLSVRKLSTEKMSDNKQIEAKSNETEDKKIIVKAKKNVKSLTSLVKNGSVTKLETREKTEDGEKRVKKIVKSKESTDKDPADGTKKKKIVRVVKKVVKNSDSSESKSDEKETTKKTLMKKITSGTKKDSSPENAAKKIREKSPEIVVKKIKEKSPEIATKKINDKCIENPSKMKEKTPEKLCKIKDPETKVSSIVTKAVDTKSSIIVPDDSLPTASQMKPCSTSKNEFQPISQISEQSPDLTNPKEPELKSNGSLPNSVQNPDSESKNYLPGLGTAKSNKVNLKLDLTKIPQHSFKIGTIAKKDSTKTESSGSKATAIVTKIVTSNESPKSDDLDSKLIENLQKTTNHAYTTESKIKIDKSSRVKEIESSPHRENPEILKNFESPCSSRIAEMSQGCQEINKEDHKKETEDRSNVSIRPTTLPLESKAPNSPRLTTREISNDHSEDIFSPLDDAESFDSWSICSADMNHHRHDLNSPTSPSYSPISRGDHPESIIDRIRRKSFYSRFNERKRKSSLNAPPPGIALSTSSTLPRKFSFHCPRDRQDYGKPSIYGGSSSRRNPERSYSLYNEETLPNYRKSSVERDRHYSDSIANIASFSGDRKSPNDQYGSLISCYDPLRRYRVSPSPESLTSHRRYPSTDYGLDNDLVTYKSPTSPTFHNDSGLESYTSRSALPRKYGSVNSCPETKTADYYEELLTPSRSDYLTSRKTPIPNDYHTRHENGYHNGTLDHRLTETDKWKTYTEKIASLDFTDSSDGRLEKQTRSNAEKDNESQDLPASRAEPDAKTSKAE